MKMKLQTVTLGCSKNKVDTEHILSHVEDLYEIVPEGEDIPVDVILLNTCGFIGDAKEESIQAVLEAVDKKKRGEAGKVIANYANDNAVALVVLGRRGLNAMQEMVFGRVSTYVMKHINCSCLLVK